MSRPSSTGSGRVSVPGRVRHIEAIAHLTRPWSLAIVPETDARIQQELVLRLALGPSLIAVRGYASQDVEQVYSRARVLCQQMGETRQLFPMLWGLWGFLW